jgi:hypothetical protein
MKWKIIFNPFEKFNELPLLIAGTIAAIIGSILFWQVGQSSDGIYHITPNAGISLATAFAENITAIVLLALLLFILGRIINPKTRWIDILNMALIHRIPFFVLGAISAIPIVKNTVLKIASEALEKNNFSLQISVKEMLILSVSGIVSLLLLAYCITLLVNGFKTAVHTKKIWHYIAFAFVAFVFSEIIYRVFIYQYLQHF